MALQKTLIIPKFGTELEFKDSYVCLHRLVIDQVWQAVKNELGLETMDELKRPVKELVWQYEATVAVYVSKEAKYAGAQSIDAVTIKFPFNPQDMVNPHNFIYAKIAELPRFQRSELV